jgi:hypothetical protein
MMGMCKVIYRVRLAQLSLVRAVSLSSPDAVQAPIALIKDIPCGQSAFYNLIIELFSKLTDSLCLNSAYFNLTYSVIFQTD